MTLTQEETERYARHLSLPELGEQGQYKLKRAHVALTGLGGLGSPAALYLPAAGVGRLTLIDPDEVCLSNLQRQILHATDAAGTAKTASAARRLYALNPSVRINTVHRRLTPENAVSLLEGCDLVLDASDNYAARFAMADAACTLRIPLVYGAVKGFIGLCSYIAASCQELVSATLIKTSVVDGVTHYDFSSAQYFWLGASVVSMLLAMTVWNAKKVVNY